jgi:hypothetical protein
MVSTRIRVTDLLRGCTPGRLQTVGNMQIVPLRSELQDDRFVAPDVAMIGTEGYGKLVIRNTQEKPMIVPAGATYIVDQAAQNHALPHAGYVKAMELKKYESAMCVQQGQGGLIKEAAHQLMLLPFPLREKAHAVRKGTNFGRLWTAIAEFNREAGLEQHSDRGHLEYFFQHYRDQLDTFVAQFEPVPDMVGCIVLIGGRVAGVERTPSANFFLSVFRPLIRECYGSLALVEARKTGVDTVLRMRTPIRRPSSRADLINALREADDRETDEVADLVAGILEVDLRRQTDEDGELTIEALGDTPFVGQLAREGEKIVYASLVATEKWRRSNDWFTARPFTMRRSAFKGTNASPKGAAG